AFIRDLTDRGLIGAALARFLRLRPPAMVATGMNALRAMRRLARSDFSAGALWLAPMERAAVQGPRVSRVFLYPPRAAIAVAAAGSSSLDEGLACLRDLGPARASLDARGLEPAFRQNASLS